MNEEVKFMMIAVPLGFVIILTVFAVLGETLRRTDIDKAGQNDLSRWRRWGGTLDRPSPPAPMRKK